MSRTVLSTLASLLVTGCVLERGSGEVVTEELGLDPFSEVVLKTAIDVRIDDAEAIGGAFTCDDNLIDNVTFEVDDDGILTIGTALVDRGFRPTVDCEAVLSSVDLVRVTNDASGAITMGDQPSLKVIRANGSGDISVAGIGELDVLVNSAGPGNVTVADGSRASSLLVETQAQGDVSVAGIVATKVNVDVESDGDITISGVTDLLDLRIRASGNLDAVDLVATEAEVDMSGRGDATIQVTKLVTGELRGSGDLTVEGEADVRVQTSGSGEVL